MIISKTGHSVNPENIIQLSKWDMDRKVNGVSYIGSLDYKLDGNRYINPITASELKHLVNHGVIAEIVTSKYSGTC